MKGLVEDGPNFNWQQKPFVQHHTDVPVHTSDDIVTSIKNIIHDVLNKSESTTLPSATPAMPNVDFDQMSYTDDVMVGVQETTNSSIITEIFQSNNTITDMVGVGAEEATNSSVTQILQNNGTILTGMTDNINTVAPVTDSTIESTSTLFTDAVSTVVDTTENIVTTVSDAVTSMVSSTTKDEVLTNSEHHGDNIEEKTLIIVLGVILVGLVLVMVILLIIYKRYKSRNGASSGAYCVTDLNEISISSTNQKEIHLAEQNVNH